MSYKFSRAYPQATVKAVNSCWESLRISLDSSLFFKESCSLEKAESADDKDLFPQVMKLSERACWASELKLSES